MILKILSIITFGLGGMHLFKNDLCLAYSHSNKAIQQPTIDPASLIDTETLKIIDECAETHSRFLKNKISQDSITKFKVFYYRNLYQKSGFSIYQYTFIKPTFGNGFGKWKCTEMGKNYHSTYPNAMHLLKWLEMNFKPNSNFDFFYLAQEPYIVTWNLKQKVLDELSELLRECPLLIGCNHPDLPWTKNAVLIPDDWIRCEEFSLKMQNLFNSPNIKPFLQRKSKVYFRGGLTGPKLPFTMKNMPNNPRQNLLNLIKSTPYLDYKVTNFNSLTDEKKDEAEYKKHILTNFSHLKSEQVDFIEHAQNKYLLSCDGIGAAWSRVPYIMATGSVLFLNAKCEQYFYRLLENQKNYIRINQDFSNLDDEFKKLEQNPKLAERIAAQGKAFAKQFLTKSSIDAYMLIILKKIESYSIK